MPRYAKGSLIEGSATQRIVDILEAFWGEWFTPEQLITEIETRFGGAGQTEENVKRAIHRLIRSGKVEHRRYYKTVNRVGLKIRVDWPDHYN